MKKYFLISLAFVAVLLSSCANKVEDYCSKAEKLSVEISEMNVKQIRALRTVLAGGKITELSEFQKKNKEITATIEELKQYPENCKTVYEVLYSKYGAYEIMYTMVINNTISKEAMDTAVELNNGVDEMLDDAIVLAKKK